MFTEAKRFVGAHDDVADHGLPEPSARAAATPSIKASIKTLVQMPEWKDVYTESAIRNLIDKARARRSSRGVIPGNGLIEAGALIRIGRRVVLDTDKFRAWVESHRVIQTTD